MTGLPWFRLYAEMPHDERIEEIAFEDRWHFINLLCMKCAGLLDKEYTDRKMRERKIARELGVDYETAGFIKSRLIDVGLIDDEWQPRGWEKRQFVSDRDPTNAARQKRYRERQKIENKEKKTSNGHRNVTVTHLDTDTDTDTDTESKPKRKRFVPPTIDEVADYCRERKNSIDAEHFVDHYEANGWVRNGGVKIKCWKACIRTWEKNDRASSVKSTNYNDPNAMYRYMK